MGLLLRAAERADAMAVAQVHVRSWQAGYRGLLPDAYLDGLRPEDRATRYDFATADVRAPSTMVAVDGDVICGFATTSPARDADVPEHGELCALYVDPEWWGRGVGAALISAARGRLLDRGFRNATLWLLDGNARADRFYRMDGWAPDGLRRTDTIWGVTVNEGRWRRALGGENGYQERSGP
ncbi:MAG TPA: GNAT family N-acetyltransferase [Acidobacteriaceae bacterium]